MTGMDMDEIQDRSILAWIVNNNIKTERGIPFDFDRFSFMIDPYEDWTPQQGVRKSAQCGWSVMTNLKLFYAARYGIPGYGIPAANVIYTLPTDNDVNTFVPSKTNQLIKHNPVIKSYLMDEDGQTSRSNVDSIQRKKVADSMVYFKGTRSKTAAIMLSADLNIHDEADRSEKSIVDEYESRLANSMYKGRWIFSNPEAPNMPADLMYLSSDQKHWFIKCEHCGTWQYLDWYKLSEFELHYDSRNPHCFVDDVNGEYLCSHCGLVITDENRKRGKWIKKYRDRQASGYWVSQMMYSWVKPIELVAIEKKKSKQYFMNFVRGLPYVGSDIVVDSQTIVNNIVLTQKTYTKGKVAMGVDNGDMKHYVIGDTDGIFKVGKTRDWDEIELMIQKYEPYTIIDLNPYPNKPRELAQQYRHVYCSFYIDQTKTLDLVEWGTRDKVNMVYPVRDLVFDDMIEYIVNGNIKFYGPKSYWEEYIKHWETMYKAKVVGNTRVNDDYITAPGQTVRTTWLSSTGEDHFAHATLYYYVALSRLTQGGGVVLTGQNPQNVIQKEMGRSPIVESGSKPNTMKPQRNYLIPRVNKVKKAGSVSGNM